MSRPRVNPVVRFKRRYRVDSSTGCWNWVGYKDKDGYGSINDWKDGMKTDTRAHRFSWELYNGDIPKGILVLHKCDNPRCVNPKHLFLGTQQDNMDDMRLKGRKVYTTPPVHIGEDNPMAKLTCAIVLELRSCVKRGISIMQAATKMGIKYRTALDVVNRNTWKHV